MSLVNPTLREVLDISISRALQDVHTTIIGKIVAINTNSVDVKPTIKRKIGNDYIDLPVFPEVPIINMQGGGSSLRFPLNVGDSCLLLINEQCFDDWYHGADDEKPLLDRKFDYSDAFCLVGINQASVALDIPNKTTLEGDLVLNGDLYIEGDFKITGDLKVEGQIKAGGDIIARVDTALEVSVSRHTHAFAQIGTPSPPIPTAIV